MDVLPWYGQDQRRAAVSAGFAGTAVPRQGYLARCGQDIELPALLHEHDVGVSALLPPRPRRSPATPGRRAGPCTLGAPPPRAPPRAPPASSTICTLGRSPTASGRPGTSLREIAAHLVRAARKADNVGAVAHRDLAALSPYPLSQLRMLARKMLRIRSADRLAQPEQDARVIRAQAFAEGLLAQTPVPGLFRIYGGQVHRDPLQRLHFPIRQRRRQCTKIRGL